MFWIVLSFSEMILFLWVISICELYKYIYIYIYKIEVYIGFIDVENTAENEKH